MTVQRMWLATPSDREVQSARTSRTVAAATTTYTLAKGIAITVPGDYRIKFTLNSPSSATYGLYGLLYRSRGGNSSPIGSERLVLTVTTDIIVSTTFVENIGGWEEGDICQLYCKSSHATLGGGKDSGFALCAEYAYVYSAIPYGKVLTDTNI